MCACSGIVLLFLGVSPLAFFMDVMLIPTVTDGDSIQGGLIRAVPMILCQ
jgi:hypothetical protein